MNVIVHLSAFLLPLILFSYWGCVGYATLGLLRTQRNTMQNLLLAPTIGIAMTVLPVFWLNRIGLPVKSFAIALTIMTLLLSFLLFYLRRPVLFTKKYYPFLAILLLSFLLMARPLAIFGFDWLSYTNDDMVNYGLGALRFYNFPYSELPNYSQLIHGKDYSLYYWFMHVSGMSRSGSELLLAWLSRLTQLNTIQVFMPLIVGFHLCLVSAAGALVYSAKRWHRLAILVCLLMTFSPLTCLGTFYQLIAQVSGLAIFITCCILLFQPFKTSQPYQVLRQSVLIGLCISALLVQYPEMSPMLGLSYVLYLIVSVAQGWRPNKTYCWVALSSLFISVIALNTYWINFFSFLQLQLHSGFSTENTSIFPYFLLPSGLANLWGLQPIAILASEPWLSVSIFLSIILSLVLIFLAVKLLAQRYVPAVVTLVMIVLGLMLFKQNSGFGLFKLSMYLQPFLIAVLVMGIVTFVRKPKTQNILLFLIVGLWLATHTYYFESSYGNYGASYNELPMASKSHLLKEIDKLQDQLAVSQDPIVLDTPSVVSAKLLGFYLEGKETSYYSNQFFLVSLKRFFTASRKILELYSKDMYDTTVNMRKAIIDSAPKKIFAYQDKAAEFYEPYIFSTHNSPVVMETPLRSILNRRELSQYGEQNYVVQPMQQINNHLIFVNSSLGQHYYFGETPVISLHNLEKDYFYPEDTMAMIGQHLLFQVINPAKQVRLELNISDSLNSDKMNLLPTPRIYGAKEYSLPITGRGAAHVFSTAFEPRKIDNHFYFMLDMGHPGKVFPTRHSSLMRLYGKDIGLDNRLLVAFARNISLVSDRDYKNLVPPTRLQEFPKDLAHPDLEFSGIYEDGWLSENAYLRLSGVSSKPLKIRLQVPKRYSTKANNVTVYVDGKKVLQSKVDSAIFTKVIPVSSGKTHVIRFVFDHNFNLPKGDDRPVSAKVLYVGFA